MVKPAHQSINSLLRIFIANESHALRGVLWLYLTRAGLHADKMTIDDLLHDVVETALINEERFDTEQVPRAWLLGIAANLVRRRQVEMYKRQQHESLIGDLYLDSGEAFSEEELLEQLLTSQSSHASISNEIEASNSVEALLNLVNESDRQVLSLAILNELDGEQLAKALSVKPSTARVRLHRALQRLRIAFLNQQETHHE